MHVYLIRHAQCELNVQLDEAPLGTRLSTSAFNTFVRGDHASPLTAEGVAQAHRLAQRLADIRFDRLYTSPLSRAMATAAVLGETCQVSPQVIDDLRELHPTLLREVHNDLTLRRLFWRSYTRMLFSPASPDAVIRSYRRARTVWHELTREPAEAIAVVSHGWVLRLLLLHIMTNRRWRIVSHDLENCGVSLAMSRTLYVKAHCLLSSKSGKE
jgi:broad specificity phosphatase PhoE